MELQVELPQPHRGVGVLGLGAGEEVRGPLDGHPGRSFEVAQSRGPGQHLAGGAAAAVSVAEREERTVRRALVLEVGDGVGELGAGQFRVVRVDGREVAEDPGAVDALPAEGVVGEPVGGVPGDLLGEEPADAGQLHQLRHGRVVAEGVGQPHLLGLDAELVEVEAFAVDQLPGEGLAAGDVGVGFHPEAAGRQELAASHLLLDAGVHLGAPLLQPGQLLGLGHGEEELRVVVHEVGDVGQGAGDLADGLAQRPEPGGVDVGVSDGGDAVGARDGGGGERRPEDRAGGGRAAGDVLEVEGVQGAVDGEEELPAAGVGLGESEHQLAEDVEVLGEFPDLGVEDGEVQTEQPVEGVAGVAGPGGPRRRVAERGRSVAVAEGGVGGGFDVVRELLAAPGGIGDRYPAVAGVEGLDDGAVGAVHQALGGEAGAGDVEAEVDDGFDAPAGPFLGDPAGDPEPAGRPGRPPAVTELDRPVPRGEAVGDRHRLAGHVPDAGPERDGPGVHGGPDPLGEHPLQALLDEALLAVHGVSGRMIGPGRGPGPGRSRTSTVRG